MGICPPAPSARGYPHPPPLTLKIQLSRILQQLNGSKVSIEVRRSQSLHEALVANGASLQHARKWILAHATSALGVAADVALFAVHQAFQGCIFTLYVVNDVLFNAPPAPSVRRHHRAPGASFVRMHDHAQCG